MGYNIKTMLIGAAVVFLTWLIYVFFKEDEQKKAMDDLLKWSVRRKNKITGENIKITEKEIDEIDSKISEKEAQLEEIKESKNDIKESSSIEEALDVFKSEID